MDKNRLTGTAFYQAKLAIANHRIAELETLLANADHANKLLHDANQLLVQANNALKKVIEQSITSAPAPRAPKAVPVAEPVKPGKYLAQLTLDEEDTTLGHVLINGKTMLVRVDTAKSGTVFITTGGVSGRQYVNDEGKFQVANPEEFKRLAGFML